MPGQNTRQVLHLEAAALAARAAELLGQGYRLALVAAHDDGPDAPGGASLRVVHRDGAAVVRVVSA